MNRRNFLQSAAATGLTVSLGTLVSPRSSAQSERPPRLDEGLVQEFVGVAHGNFDRTRELLRQEPRLVNATWDWGGGDFETALGGAAHMGNREIALYLLDEGARLDLFAAAMLGRIEIIRAALTIDPGSLHVPGPHGIPLIVHAQKGGEPAAEVVAYLESLGETDRG